jgi:hypothetical protein
VLGLSDALERLLNFDPIFDAFWATVQCALWQGVN